jgi:uncharacterized protein YoxC
MVMELAVLLIAIAVVVLTAFLIPVVIEAKKTVVTLREVTESLGNQLKPTLQELQGTLSEAKGLVAQVTARTEEVKTLTTALGETGHNLRVINNALGSAATVVASTAAWGAGIKAAMSLVLDRLSKKRKEEG